MALRRWPPAFVEATLALIVLIAFWRWLWGPCWNPLETICFTAPGTGDHVQHYYGWLAYARGGLSTWLPPRFSSWTWPQQTPLLFADPIPLAAILAAPVARVLRIDFQYFSLLSLLSMVGSFLCGIWIGRYFSLRSYQATFLAILLALSPPALLRLIGHEALSLHVILVLAISLVIRRLASLRLWLPLIAVSMGIHAYFTPMVLALGLYVQWACGRGPRQWPGRSPLPAALRFWLKRLMLSAGVLLASAYLFGYLPNHAAVSPEGAMWSANMLAAFDSQGKSLFFPPLAKQEPLQWEGFSYLGLLGVVAVCLSLGWRLTRANPQLDPRPTIFPRPLAYGFLTAGFLLFSFGDAWLVGQVQLLHLDGRLPLLKPLMQTFRSSGRFMWPVYYSLMIWGCVSIMRVTRRPRLVVIAFLVLALESYLPMALFVKKVIAKHSSEGERWQRRLERGGIKVKLLRNAEVLYNATGDPFFYTDTLPRFLPQAVNPEIATNYNPYLARYPRGFQRGNKGSACKLVGRFFKKSRLAFNSKETYLIMHNSDQQSCLLTKDAALKLPLNAAEPTSIFLVRRPL